MSVDHHPTFEVPAENEVMSTKIFWARCKYDFAVDGGAQGAITLAPNTIIPDNSLILGAYMNVIVAPTSGGAAEAALHVNAAGDLDAAGVISAAPWSTTGRKVLDHALGSAPIELTADRNVTLTITVADLPAGEVDILIAYLPPGL